jgi:type I restriction enzyme S subunit
VSGVSKAVPDGWSVQSLEEKVEILSGFPFKSSLFCDDRNRIGLIRIRDLEKQSLETFYAGDFDEAYVVQKGDILIGMDGDFNIVKWKARDALLNQRICKVKASIAGGFHSDFLFYALVDDLESIHAATGATTVKHLSVKDIRGIEKAYPPLPEQQKIATILSSVDKVIETTRAQIDKLKDLKTGMMQELLTKGIGHTEFKDSPLGRIPVGWDVLTVSQVCSEIVDCVNKTAPVVDYVTPYKMIRTTNVRDGRIDTTNVRYVTEETYSTWTRRIDLKPGDLIFTREAPVGECGIIQDARGLFLGQRTMVYRVNPEMFDNLFLLWSVQSEFWKSQVDDLSGGSTTPHLRVPDCSKILVKVPPLAEQKVISNAINSVESFLHQRQQKLAEIEQIKKALMQDLLTGKVRVKVDEPEKESAVA